MLRLDLGDERAAHADCDEAIRLNPKRPWAFYYRALARLRRNEAEAAIEDLDCAVNLDEGLARPRRIRGLVLLEKGVPAGAIVELGKAIVCDRQFAAAYRDRACAWMAMHDADEGLTDIDLAIRLDAEDPLSYLVRGRLRAEKGQWKSAVEDFNAVLRGIPTRPNPTLNAATAGCGWVSLRRP